MEWMNPESMLHKNAWLRLVSSPGWTPDLLSGFLQVKSMALWVGCAVGWFLSTGVDRSTELPLCFLGSPLPSARLWKPHCFIVWLVLEKEREKKFGLGKELKIL